MCQTAFSVIASPHAFPTLFTRRNVHATEPKDKQEPGRGFWLYGYAHSTLLIRLTYNYLSVATSKAELGSGLHGTVILCVAPFGVTPIGVKKAFSCSLPITPFGVTLISVIWRLRKIPSFLARLSTTQISSTALMNSANSSETWQMAKKCSCYHRDASERV